MDVYTIRFLSGHGNLSLVLIAEHLYLCLHNFELQGSNN